MSGWHPDAYLQFEAERIRPCRDLVARIRIEQPRSVIDLGCGPGNSTDVLAERWPLASITGLDNSPEMLDCARRNSSRHTWIAGGIAEWAALKDSEYDVVFSNAALQWLSDHASLYPRLLAKVAAGGVLAVQVPADVNAPAHRIMRDLAASGAWRDRFQSADVREWFVHDAEFYYDLLAKDAGSIDLWQTEYLHSMPNVESIGEWYKATGLRPFLEALDTAADRDQFVRDYVEALRGEYKPRTDGQVLFPFRRLFLIAAAT